VVVAVPVVVLGEERRQQWRDGQQQFRHDLRFRYNQLGEFRNDGKRHQFFRYPRHEHEPEFKYDDQSERSKQHEQAESPALKSGLALRGEYIGSVEAPDRERAEVVSKQFALDDDPRRPVLIRLR
jgi:hypothetical protein